jgi:3-methyladenine DNA glycosylase AlkD
MALDVGAAVAALEEGLTSSASPERAEQERRYLKSDLEFIGASYWQTGRLVKAFAVDHRDLGRSELLDLVGALWARPIFELRACAAALLDRYGRLLGAGDLPLLERMLRQSGTWALVDDLAVHAVGRVVIAAPAVSERVLDGWSADGDFWIRRASLLGELPALRDGAAFDRFARRADALLEEREFFIRKAIGWVLREVGKRRPAEVVAWLEPRTSRASGVTMREAVRYLPAADGKRLMAAYRSAAHRPRQRGAGSPRR